MARLDRREASFRSAACAAALAALAGCSTIHGTQDVPIGFKPKTASMRYDEALFAYAQPTDAARNGLTREEYRDYVIDLYLIEIENKYERFKTQLATSDRGSALAGDLLILALNGATALAGASATNELATITAVASGGRAAIDKRLFFDRTIPAVIAAIDARRAVIKAEIARKRMLPDADYGLGTALADLRRLTAAGEINSGVERITSQAVADKTAAEARLAKIVEGCAKATGETPKLNQEFNLLLTEDASKRVDRMADAASVLKLDAGATPTMADLRTAFDREYCDDAGKRVGIDLIKQKITAREGD